MANTNFLTPEEVAQWLKVGYWEVRTWLQKGQLRGYKLPDGDWRIKPENVETMLELSTKVDTGEKDKEVKDEV